MVASIGKIVSPARVLVGDERQLGAVEAGKPFGQLRAAGMTRTVKDDIVRQGASGSAIRHAGGVGRVIMPGQENARAWACSGGAGVSRIASQGARAQARLPSDRFRSGASAEPDRTVWLLHHIGGILLPATNAGQIAPK